MHVNDIPRILRRTWPIIIVVTLLVTGAMWALAKRTPSYLSMTVVAIRGINLETPEEAGQVATYIAGEMNSFQALMGTEEVLADAARRSGVDISPEQLSRSVVVAAKGQTLSIQVSSSSLSSAEALSLGMAEATAAAINEFLAEGAYGDAEESAVALAEVSHQLPNPTTGDSMGRKLVTGVLLGLIAGIGIALTWNFLRNPVGSAVELARGTDERVIGSNNPISLENLRQLRAFLEAEELPGLLVVAGAQNDTATGGLVSGLASALTADGYPVRAVSYGPALTEGEGYSVENLSKDGQITKSELARLSEATEGITIVAAPALHSNGDALRLAGHADLTLVTASVRNNKRQVLGTVDAARASGADLLGILVVK